jgi:hypothetical protein
MNLLLHIQGGLGKCIMTTAVIRNWKLAYPESEIVVVSGYPEVFLHNPDVARNFTFNHPYLWADYYSDPDYKIYAQDVYLTQDWIQNKRKHFIEIFCDELGVDFIQQTPLLYFSSAEIDEFKNMVKVDKPLLVVQSTGGSNAGARSWTRTPPQEEFDEYLKQFLEENYVLHLAVPETPVLQNVHQRVDNLDRRKAMGLAYFAYGLVGIDSFAMHARAANNYSGSSTFFFPLEESRVRLGYVSPNTKHIVPRPEIQELIRNSSDYYATVFQYNIESNSENCPVPPGQKWF